MSEDRNYIITMPDGSKWAIPVLSIAYDRARSYADEFGGDVRKSLTEDTLPLFESDDYEIADWARNNMNWSDVESVAELYEFADEVDYQEGWMNGEYEVKVAQPQKGQDNE